MFNRGLNMFQKRGGEKNRGRGCDTQRNYVFYLDPNVPKFCEQSSGHSLLKMAVCQSRVIFSSVCCLVIFLKRRHCSFTSVSLLTLSLLKQTHLFS